MKGDTKILIGVGVSLAAVVGLVAWGVSRGKALAGPAAQNVALFPDLKVGDIVLVDATKANLRSALAQIVCTVDLVLTDPSVVSVRETAPLVPPGEHGTIPRDAILRVLSTGRA